MLDRFTWYQQSSYLWRGENKDVYIDPWGVTDAVPADKYSYRPTESVRTFGQLIGHVADAYNYFCARAAGQNVQWADPIEKGNTDKATIVPKLKQSLATCTTAYGGANQVGPLVDNVAHTNLHYGNVITYMRMMGLVPPSSR